MNAALGLQHLDWWLACFWDSATTRRMANFHIKKMSCPGRFFGLKFIKGHEKYCQKA